MGRCCRCWTTIVCSSQKVWASQEQRSRDCVDSTTGQRRRNQDGLNARNGCFEVPLWPGYTAWWYAATNARSKTLVPKCRNRFRFVVQNPVAPSIHPSGNHLFTCSSKTTSNRLIQKSNSRRNWTTDENGTSAVQTGLQQELLDEINSAPI